MEVLYKNRLKMKINDIFEEKFPKMSEKFKLFSNLFRENFQKKLI